MNYSVSCLIKLSVCIVRKSVPSFSLIGSYKMGRKEITELICGFCGRKEQCKLFCCSHLLCSYIIWSRTFTSLQMLLSALLIKLLIDLNKTINSFDLENKKVCR